jgi:hypothetical protein
MALPSISAPEFKTTIPSTGQQITYRPFLVKEEKVLLMAMEGDDTAEITNAISNILKSCVLDEIDPGKLSTFDIEYLFLQLRGKSVGEVIELSVSHPDSECKHRTDVKVNIDEIKLVGGEIDSKIMLTDTIGVKMRYPTMAQSLASTNNKSETDILFELIASCVEYVFDETDVYNEFSAKEMEEWVNSLNQTQFKKIVEFLQEIPKLQHEIKWKCDACGEEDSVILEGMQSFFS